MKFTFRVVVAAMLATFGLCQSASAEFIYGIGSQGSGQFLVKWDSSNPTVLASSIPLIAPNASPEAIIAIDFRPKNGALWGLGASGATYIIPLSSPAIYQTQGGIGPVNGFSFGFDFNPSIDRIRVTSDVNQNLVLNPNTGSLQTTATNLFFGPADPNFGVDPNIGASAYSNNVDLAPTTQLYGIDMGLDILVTQANNAGTLGTVGPLGVNVSALGGFDISGASGVAYATMTPANSSQSNFYSINLVTGAATNLGPIGGGIVITAMSVFPVPEPTTLGLCFAGVLALAAARRRQG